MDLNGRISELPFASVSKRVYVRKFISSAYRFILIRNVLQEDLV